MAVGKEPIKQQPDNGLGAIFNKLSREIKRCGQIQGIAPIVVKNNAAGIFIGYDGQPGDKGKYILITDGGGEEHGNKYSWVAIKINDDGAGYTQDTQDTGSHTEDKGYAVEVGAFSPWVLWGSIVKAYPLGSNWAFEYKPEIVAATTKVKIGSESSGEVIVDVVIDGSHKNQTIKVDNWWSLSTDKERTIGIAYGQGKWGIIAEDCPPPEDEVAEE